MSSAQKTTIRPAIPEDMPRLRELSAEMSTMADAPFTGLPVLERDEEGNYQKPPYLLEMWVVELEGEIINAFYIEKALEFCMVGRDPRGTAAVKEFASGPINVAQDMGMRVIHCHQPPEFPDAGKHLEDMDFFRTGYEHFTIRLR